MGWGHLCFYREQNTQETQPNRFGSNSSQTTVSFLSLIYIVQVVKVQMQAKENLGRYTGVINCASSLVQTEGPFALYKGLESHLWRNAVWNGELTVRGPL